MRSFDARFRPVADPEVTARLRAAPVGSVATIRDVVFRKITPNGWENDFRSGMTSAEVASVISADGSVVTPERVR